MRLPVYFQIGPDYWCHACWQYISRLVTKLRFRHKGYKPNKLTKHDVRGNRNNIGERRGFLGRVVHGDNPRTWLKEISRRIGEGIDSMVID